MSMSEGRPAFAIEYARPDLAGDVRQVMVLRLTAIAAGLSALSGCIELAILAQGFFLDPSGAGPTGWDLLRLGNLVTTPLLVTVAVLSLRRHSIERLAVICRLLLILFVILTAVGLAESLPFVLFIFKRSPLQFRIVAASLMASRVGGTVWLLMPVLLLSARDIVAWRGRALIVAFVMIAISGTEGVANLINDGWTIQMKGGGSVSEGVRAALSVPLPIIGWWRLLGWASAFVLFISWLSPHRQTIAFGALMGIVFCVAITIQQSYWGANLWHLSAVFTLWKLRGALSYIDLAVIRALPLWLLVWATMRRSKVFVDDETPILSA